MPFKSSLARSAGKPFGVFKERDLSLRGATQGTRFVSSEVNPREHFDTTLFTGTGAAKTISGLSMAPDLLWFKARNGADSHVIIDSVRGGSKVLLPDLNSGEGTDATNVTAFNSDGWTMGTNSTYGSMNISGRDYVTWAWNAGSSTVTNTDGSVDSEVRANTTAGFSISTWTSPSSNPPSGWTLGHGLSSVPKFMVVKNRSTTGNWTVYHASVGNTTALYLNDASNGQTNQSLWNNTTPTSTTWSAGSTGWYGTSNDFVTYAWSEVEGFSKFGSFTGTWGVHSVTCGFEPTFLMIKRTENGSDGDTAYGGWIMLDNKRTGNNDQLYADCSQAEGGRGNCSGTGDVRESVTFTSTGFDLKSAYYETNDTIDYIYAAFA